MDLQKEMIFWATDAFHKQVWRLFSVANQ